MDKRPQSDVQFIRKLFELLGDVLGVVAFCFMVWMFFIFALAFGG